MFRGFARRGLGTAAPLTPVSGSTAPVALATSGLSSPSMLSTTTSSTTTQYRFQVQAGGPQFRTDVEGNIRVNYTSAGNRRKLNPAKLHGHMKSSIQKERRDMGLSEIDDWEEFAATAYWLKTSYGGTFIGPDDPRAARVMRRKAKLEKKPGQVERFKPGKDPSVELEDHFYRKYFVSPQDPNNPMEVAEGLWRAGYIKEFDVKHTAANMTWKPRTPIISIMGHVDHGKTTLLDYLRNANVAAGEAGGITQSIGAFSVSRGEEKITFIDTPGHAAFTSMREAGAELTDIVILIVSVVDGVQPQTLEVIDLVKKHNVPMVVALNKIDRAEQNIPKVKKQLLEAGVELEEEGGDVLVTGIAALTGEGVNDLLDNVLLQASMCECQTPEKSRVEISVIDSKTPKDVPMVSGIVKSGVLKPGMTMVTGTIYGTVQKIFDESGLNPLKTAGPGTPVTFTGTKVLPKPGVTMMQVSSREHGERYSIFMQEVYQVEGNRETYFQMLSQDSSGHIWRRKHDHDYDQVHDRQPLDVVVRAGTFGQLQALLTLIYELPHIEGTHVKVFKTEVGGMNSSDVVDLTAIRSKGVILHYGDTTNYSQFDVPGNIEQFDFKVVYHGIQWLKQRIVGLLPKRKVEEKVSTAECKDVFRASQADGGNAGGMLVKNGKLRADASLIRVYRKDKKKASRRDETGFEDLELDGNDDGEIVYEGTIKELRRFKEIVPSIDKGLECGVILHDGFQFQAGDMLHEIHVSYEDHDVDEVFQAAEEKEAIARAEAKKRAEEEAEMAALNGNGEENDDENLLDSAASVA